MSLILGCLAVLLAIGVLALVGTAHAATYYVSQAPNANDINTCLLLAAPCRTITQGIMVADSPGDVVLVRAGSYVELVVRWPWSGAPGRPITINPREIVVWTGSYTDHRDGAITISTQNEGPRNYPN